MSQNRQDGFKPEHHVYHEWHRALSLNRFIPNNVATSIYANDLDLYEWCLIDKTVHILMLIEIKKDSQYARKNYKKDPFVALAKRSNLPAYLIFYQEKADEDVENPDDKYIPTNLRQGTKIPDIKQFYVKRLWPDQVDWTCSAHTWANELVRLRNREIKKIRSKLETVPDGKLTIR